MIEIFETLNKQVETFYKRLESITIYINKVEEEKTLIQLNKENKIKGLNIKFNKYIDLITIENNSTINYNAIIISLYGCFENFIDNILVDFLEIIATLGIEYDKLKKAILTNHERLVGNFLSNSNRYKNYELTTKEIINRLNSCLNNQQDFKLNSRILITHGGNLNFDTVNNLFNQIGIQNIWHKIKQTKKFKEYYKKTKNILEDESIEELFKNNKNDNLLFNIINDLVERRNSVAHSWEEENRISFEEIKEEYIPFLKVISEVIYRILIEEIYEYLFNNNKLFKIEKIYKLYNNQILCINSGESCINKFDYIYVINSHQKKLFNIQNMQINNKDVNKCNKQEDIGILLDDKISSYKEVYILKREES